MGERRLGATLEVLLTLALFSALLLPVLVGHSILESAYRNAAKAEMALPDILRYLTNIWRWTEWLWPEGVTVGCLLVCWRVVRGTQLGLRKAVYLGIALSLLGLVFATLIYWWVDTVIHQ